LKEIKSKAISEIRSLLSDIKKKEPYVWRSAIAGDWKKKTEFAFVPKGEKCTFSPEQEKLAASLVNLLDISFDPIEDRLNSLRSGKLDVRKLAEVIPGNLNVYYKIEQDQSTRPFSVCLLVDESGSMRCDDRISKAKNLVKILYLAFDEILPKDKLWVMGHSGGDSPRIYIYKDPYNDTFEETIEKMTSRSENYDGPVIEAIHERIRKTHDDNIIFIVLSDGSPSGSGYGCPKDVQDLRRIVEKARRDSFLTIGIGIDYNTNHLYDYNCTVRANNMDMIRKTSYIINQAVKNEFQ
jgi:hypothetical protein